MCEKFAYGCNTLVYCIVLKLYSDQHWRSTETCAAALGLPTLAMHSVLNTVYDALQVDVGLFYKPGTLQLYLDIYVLDILHYFNVFL